MLCPLRAGVLDGGGGFTGVGDVDDGGAGKVRCGGDLGSPGIIQRESRQAGTQGHRPALAVVRPLWNEHHRSEFGQLLHLNALSESHTRHGVIHRSPQHEHGGVGESVG